MSVYRAMCNMSMAAWMISLPLTSLPMPRPSQRNDEAEEHPVSWTLRIGRPGAQKHGHMSTRDLRVEGPTCTFALSYMY